jgi:hypothetical protein
MSRQQERTRGAATSTRSSLKPTRSRAALLGRTARRPPPGAAGSGRAQQVPCSAERLLDPAKPHVAFEGSLAHCCWPDACEHPSRPDGAALALLLAACAVPARPVNGAVPAIPTPACPAVNRFRPPAPPQSQPLARYHAVLGRQLESRWAHVAFEGCLAADGAGPLKPSPEVRWGSGGRVGPGCWTRSGSCCV